MQSLIDQVILWLPRMGVALAVFIIFWVLAGLACRAVVRSSGMLRLDPSISSLMSRLAKAGLMIFGLITALGTLGVDVSALVAGLGLTGFALGFALKDTISNILAGILLLIYRPFKVSDRIQIAGHEGTVVSIDLRYTTIENGSNKILIPNSSIFTNPIVILGKLAA